jgi:hypothetical protein
MKKTSGFDDILSSCLDRILKGETVEGCLNSYPEQAGELEPLLRTAAAAKLASEIQPRAEFKARARHEFQTALKEMRSHKVRRPLFSAWRWQWHPGLAIAVVAVFLIVAAGGGTVAAASNSMPDSALYPVKLAKEKVQMEFTFSAVGKAELNARLADERVNEIVYAASKGDTQEVLATAGRLSDNLENIGTLIVDAGSSQPILAGGTAGNDSNATANNENPPMVAANQPVPSPTPMLPSEASPPALKHTFGLAVAPALSPAPGAANVPVNPTFSWPPTDNAAGYDFQIANNPEFDNTIESRAGLPTNSCVLTETLDKNTTYFWRYRETNSGAAAAGDWVQNAFTTGTEYATVTMIPELPPIIVTVPATDIPEPSAEPGNEATTSLDKLAHRIVQYAASHPARLEEALAKAPPDVRPALRQAIARTSSEYDKLIKEIEKTNKKN